MKNALIILASFAVTTVAFADVLTTNRNAVGLEHNLLFNATSRYTVSQTGAAPLYLPYLFDGKFEPSYTNAAAVAANPTVITIEGLPNAHVQVGATVGWSTRWWPAEHFKIEAYDSYAEGNHWITVADYSTTSYSGYDFAAKITDASVTKLRFTFYTGTGDAGRLGVSELYFLHPEAAVPYEGLYGAAGLLGASGDNIGIGTLVPASKLHIGGSNQAIRLDYNGSNAYYGSLRWAGLQLGNNGENRIVAGRTSPGAVLDFYVNNTNDGADYLQQPDGILAMRLGSNGNVGIGTTNPTHKLAVNGTIKAKEVIVETSGWSDYVFDDDYTLQPLAQVEAHIKVHKHLPGIPSAATVATNGVSVGDMQAALLAKVEELTLHLIAQEKELARLRETEKDVAALRAELRQLRQTK